MTVLDLFSGIGGFSLGFEWAGLETVAFCEADGYARRVLKKHWPYVSLYEDVRTLTAKRLRQDGIPPIDVVCGGFPCQDISMAGKGAGLEGARSGLWFEMLRIVKETRPRWVIAENVPALRGRGADRVLTDLEGVGYTVRPVVVGAWTVGGNHQRDRVWVVANSTCIRHQSSLAETSAIESGDVVELQWAGGPADRDGFWPQRYEAIQGARRPYAKSLICRASDDVPFRVDRLRCLGNAVIPLIPELIARFILEAEARA